MCVITNEKDIVQSVSLIPGAELKLPEGWHVYFPVVGVPCIGEVFINKELEF